MEETVKETRLISLLKSKDTEMYKVGLEICKSEYPALWAALINLTGVTDITEEILAGINANCHINIGSVVRVRGLSGSPDMVVVDAKIDRISGAKLPAYKTVLTCRYYNKSKQEFSLVSERIECFELVQKPTDIKNK